MIKQIKLESNSKIGSLVNSEPFFLLNDEALQIEFVGDVGGLLLATVKNGDKHNQALVSNRKFTVPKELVTEGELEIIVSLYDGATIEGKWICEPIIIIKPTEDVFEVHPKIIELENQIAELRAEISFLKDTTSDLRVDVGRLWRIVES